MRPRPAALAALLALLAAPVACRKSGGPGPVRTPGAPVVVISVDTLLRSLRVA